MFTPFVPGADFFAGADETTETVGLLRMLSVGKFVGRKRHDLAVACLKSSTSDATLTIVGERSTAEHEVNWHLLIRLVDQEGLKERTTVTANVSPKSMPALFRKHDLLLMIAEREPASMSVVEALASGLVVVVRSDNRTSAFVEVSGLGVVIPASGSEGLAQAIADATGILRRTSRVERQSRFIHLFGPTTAIASWNDLLTDK
jgi:glycosyltransferase involved in cell wall biosynthesis